MKYLFWNTHKNEGINPILCDLIIENNISVVILAEYVADATDLCALLKIRGLLMRPGMTIGCERITVLTANGVDIEPATQTDKASFQIINKNIILSSVHFNSKIYGGHKERREIVMAEIVSDLLKLENDLNTNNSIIVGDFNINPYEDSCVNARYFHGIPIYEEAMKGYRTVEGKMFYMFYNPMWNFLGDFSEPYGTYYCNTSETVNPYWNIFDQVIIRPALRARFVDNNLKIITKTSNVSLLDNKKHPDTKISDHLPITFEIKEDNI